MSYMRSSSATTRASSGGLILRSWILRSLAGFRCGLDRDDRYFADSFQAMPKHGYTCMFEKDAGSSKDHDSDRRELRGCCRGVSRSEDESLPDRWMSSSTIRFGPLPYRSLEFKHETHDVATYQAAAVVNYPNDHAYTRVTEFKYLTGQVADKTSIVFEYPKEEGDPYYPIPRPENAAIYAKYKELADRASKVHFRGAAGEL